MNALRESVTSQAGLSTPEHVHQYRVLNALIRATEAGRLDWTLTDAGSYAAATMSVGVIVAHRKTRVFGSRYYELRLLGPGDEVTETIDERELRAAICDASIGFEAERELLIRMLAQLFRLAVHQPAPDTRVADLLVKELGTNRIEEQR